ncbi:hypothetical protein AAG906_020994 [Vitis piasezkii]
MKWRYFEMYNYPVSLYLLLLDKVVVGNGNCLNISNIGYCTILLCINNNVTVEFFTNGFVMKDQASKKVFLQGNLDHDSNGNKIVRRTSLAIEVPCMLFALQLPNKVFQAFIDNLLPSSPISFLLPPPLCPPSKLVPISNSSVSISFSKVTPIPTTQPLSSYVLTPCHLMIMRAKNGIFELNFVVKPTTIRVVLSLALSRNWSIQQLDIQPPGFVDPSKPNFVCKLTKALYGLKQTPWAWFTKLNSALVKWVYIDDIIVTDSNSLLIEQLISSLNSCFALKDLGPLNFFLGIELVASLMATGLVLFIVDGTKLEDPTFY